MKSKTAIITQLIIVTLLAACGSSPEAVTPTPVPPPTDTPVPTMTQTPTLTPSPTPEPVGGGSGQILYINRNQEQIQLESGTLSYPVYQLEKMDLLTGEPEALITLDMLEEELGAELYQARFTPSPDGSQVVISVATAISADGPEQYENYLSDLELNSLVPILDTGAEYVEWIWSPDGTMLMGDTVIDNSRGVLVVNNDGSGLRKVIKSGLVSSPIWGPDSLEIYSIILGIPVRTDLDGNESQIVGLENLDDSLITMSFSPDGEHVAYLTKEGEIYLANSDFSEEFQIDIESRYLHCRNMIFPTFQGWSKDSTHLIFRDVTCFYSLGVFQPSSTDYLIRVSDGSVLNDPFNPGGIGPCGWSPDGHLVYAVNMSDGIQLRLVPGDIETPSRSNRDFEISYPGFGRFTVSCPTWVQ